jgi:hypothetical protein
LRESEGFASGIVNFFSEFSYPIDLSEPFYDEVCREYGIENEGGREIVVRRFAPVRSVSVVSLDLNVGSITIDPSG